MQGLVACTMECNMACNYCFEGNGDCLCPPDRQSINRKAQECQEFIIRFIDELYDYNGERNTRIIWHGGEPTLIDPDFYEEIMSDQIKKCHKILWGMQTNGTLITERYASLIERFSIGVGISIDGLQEQHDAFRILKNGKPTFDLIMRNLQRIKSDHIGTLITITDKNVNQLREIYDFFAENNWSFGFNALYPTTNQGTTAELNQEMFAAKICDLFDYWIEDQKHNINITNFKHIMAALFFPERGVPLCNWSPNCSGSFVAMDIEGYLYNCEHFVSNKKYSIGHISEGLKNVVQKRGMFSERPERLKTTLCRDCDIFSLCNGGCPWCAMQLTGDFMQPNYNICTGRRRLVHHIYDYVNNNYSKREIKFQFAQRKGADY